MTTPLDGIRVIEIGQMIAVPAATHILASYGAEVIKVENTGAGDELRFYGSNKGGMSGWFANANGGKRSISIDLKEDAGKEILWKLIETADVVIEGFRPGVLDRLGFAYEDVSRKRPGIIYCSSTGFGPVGPYADRPVYDPLIQSMAGWAGAQRVSGDPSLVKSVVADKIAAWGNAQAVTTALVKAARTGEGSHIQLSMLESNLQFVWPDTMMHCTLLDEEHNAQPNTFNNYRIYQCKDGWVSIAGTTDKQAKGICEALDHGELLERFASATRRSSIISQWFDAQDRMVKQFTVQEVIDRLMAVDVPVARVLKPEEVYADQHIRAAGFVREVDHPVVGRMLTPRPPGESFGEAIELVPAPLLGEHSAEILAEIGYEDQHISQLLLDGVVRQS